MWMKRAHGLLVGSVLIGMTFSAGAGKLQAAQDPGPPPPMPVGQPPSAPLPPDQLQELVAPIALYPDALVAQILAASAYPTQIVEAERFMQENPGLQGQALGSAVDGQDWDPSVKALTQFPSVLANMDKDLSWTSELGDANVNQSADVMQAIQYMRGRAQSAGNLNSTPQENVSDAGGNIDIAPSDPNVVYVPEYNPEFIYGYSVGLWPGFDPWWSIGGPYMSFGVGFGMEPFFGFGWGWHGWGMDWRHGGMMYGGDRYMFHSHAFYDRNSFMHGNYSGYGGFARGDRGLRGYGGGSFGGNRAGGFGGGRSGARPGGYGGVRQGGVAVARPGGFGAGSNVRGFTGTRSSAFSGRGFGGQTRGFSSRGMSSMGGGGFGGGMRGGGGMHGGGVHR